MRGGRVLLYLAEFIEQVHIPAVGQAVPAVGVEVAEADLVVVADLLVEVVLAEVGNFEQFQAFAKYLLKKTCSFPKM